MSRVKISEETVFLFFSSEFFFGFWAKNFSDFWPNTSRKCENCLLRVHRNNLWLYIFLKSFEPFWIFYRNLWHGSQNSIYVSRVKISEETVFLFSFSEFFSDFERKFFSDFWPKNFMKFSKLPSTCPEEQFVAWNFFLKFWIVSDFLQKPLTWFSKVYICVQSKNFGRNSFLIFLFRIFSDFERKFFSDFRPKNFMKFSKIPSTCPEEQFVAWNFFLKFWIVSDFLQKPLAWFSKFYLRVQSKKCGKNSFFCFLFRFFSIFGRKFFRLLAKKLQKFVKTTFACPEEQLVALKFF